jgi:transposase
VARLLDPVRIGRRRRPACLVGDKAYSTRPIRAWARRHHVQLIVPERVDQIAQRAHRPGRKPRFDRAVYRGRNIVERAVGWLKRWRRLATRADKLAVCYHAASCVVLATRYAAMPFSDTT